MKKIFYISFLLLLFTACEKDIIVDLPDPEKQYIVEGYIEQNQHPYVFVSKNIPYFEKISINSLMNKMVLDAEVIVSDGIISETLELIYDPLQFPYYKYVGNSIIGEAGKTYYLTIKIGDETLTSSTIIPNPVKLDSLKYIFEEKYITNNDSIDSLGIGFLWFYFNDPDTLGNYYKLYTKVLGEDPIFYAPYSSVAEDKIINNQFVEFSTYRGQNPLVEVKNYYDWFFKGGDTIIFKFTSIDVRTYQFWLTLELDNSNGGPFASPITIKTNINGGLGIWGGYGVCIDTAIAPIKTIE
jgi:hypothetical protein